MRSLEKNAALISHDIHGQFGHKRQISIRKVSTYEFAHFFVPENMRNFQSDFRKFLIPAEPGKGIL